VEGISWIPRGDPGFPALLEGIADAPPGLWVRSGWGPEALAERLWSPPAVALVGSRGASCAGLELARQFAWGLARAGVVVVSGLARGVDAAAHAGALEAGGATVAVLGCGADVCYPPEHERLAARIASRGAILSEWPSGTPALPWRFPRRNRLISGLSRVTVLVEGRARSGAWHTVAAALDQGREVMAVPRDPLLPGSAAPNRLIRDGAAPATSAEDVLALLDWRRAPGDRGRGGAQPLLPPGDSRPRARAAHPRAGGAAPGAARIEARLRRGDGVTLEQLAGGLPEVPLADLQARLVTLEVEGLVRRERGGLLRWAGSA